MTGEVERAAAIRLAGDESPHAPDEYLRAILGTLLRMEARQLEMVAPKPAPKRRTRKPKGA